MAYLNWIIEDDNLISYPVGEHEDAGLTSSFVKNSVAKELDELIDQILDGIVENLILLDDRKDKNFHTAYLIGESFLKKGFNFYSPNGELSTKFFEAIMNKIILGGSVHSELNSSELQKKWSLIVPNTNKKGHRGSRGFHYLQMCTFLADPVVENCSVDDLGLIFGYNTGNVFAMGERPGVRDPNIRRAMHLFAKELSESEKVEVYKVKNYQSLMRDLRSYFPKQGAGSNKKPDQFSPEEIKDLIKRISVGLGLTKNV